jgi:ApbE superfamily uncharacterized protein (UPF0280 family)
MLKELLKEAAVVAVRGLEELSNVLPQARMPFVTRKNEEQGCSSPPQPRVLQYMYEAIEAAGDPSLTPMAAVAGSIADLVAESLVRRGATKAFANNGGDISIKLASGEQTSIGIMSDMAKGTISHTLALTSLDGIGGVATSGLGGRSLTKGVAEAVVVLADNARLADACATLIANETLVQTPEVFQVKAETLDPQTDLPGHMVTLRVGILPSAMVQKALVKGKEAAEHLQKKGIIRGAFIFVQGKMTAVPRILLTKTVQVTRK